MTSPKSASSKRAAPPPRRSDYANELLKDWERLTHSGRFNMKQLKEVMMLLIANDGPLSAEWKDHALTGDWAVHRVARVS
jgi:mRNA interferase YafQ